jgi:hypothetical protein
VVRWKAPGSRQGVLVEALVRAGGVVVLLIIGQDGAQVWRSALRCQACSVACCRRGTNGTSAANQARSVGS